MPRMLVLSAFEDRGGVVRLRKWVAVLCVKKTGGEEIWIPRLPARLLPYRRARAISCCMASITAMGSAALEMGRPTTT